MSSLWTDFLGRAIDTVLVMVLAGSLVLALYLVFAVRRLKAIAPEPEAVASNVAVADIARLARELRDRLAEPKPADTDPSGP